MVTPITYSRKIIGTGAGPYYRDTAGFVQKKPYNLVLEVESRVGSVQGEQPWDMSGTVAGNAFNALLGYDFASVDNRCYSRFIGKLQSDQAELGVTLAESRASVEMLKSRTRQLFKLSKALKERRFSDAYRTLRVPPGSRPTSVGKDLASNYLEWSWGWRPLVEDIGNALTVLTSTVKPQLIRAAATSEVGPYTTEYDSQVFTSYGVRTVRSFLSRESVVYRVSTGAKVEISNPNVVLANKLGLLNLPGIFWAVQPFSFVVDKYVNIGQVIGSLTDLYGFTLTDTWTSRTVKLTGSGYRSEFYFDPQDGRSLGSMYRNQTTVGVAKRRKTGLLKPVLTFRTPTIGSLSEAVSYIALTVQLLRS